MDVEDIIRCNFWDMFDTNESIELQIDMIKTHECSEIINSIPLMTKFCKLNIYRNDSEDLIGELYFEKEYHDLYEEYKVELQTSPEQFEDYIFSFDSGIFTVTMACSESQYFAIDENFIIVDVKKINYQRNAKFSDSITEYYINALDFILDDKKTIEFNINIETTKESDNSSETLSLDNISIAELPAHTFYIEDKEIEIWQCDDVSDREHTIAIKYHWNASEEFRILFTDFLSFLLGSRMIKIAEKEENNHLSKLTSFSLYESTMYEKQRNTSPQLFDSEKQDLINTINRLYPAFKEKYEMYHLNHFLTLYWHASTQSKSVAIVLYQMAIEVLVNAYAEHIEGTHIITEEEMNDTCGPELYALCRKLHETYGEESEGMIYSIRSSVLKSHSRLLKNFSNFIGVHIGKKEKNLIGKANCIRHGEEVDRTKTNEICNFYVTYSNRLILALLGEYEYYDYTEKIDDKTTYIVNSTEG